MQVQTEKSGQAMKFLEDVILTDSIEINASPGQIYEFFMNLNHDTYKQWVPGDHVAFCWLKGKPWQKGAVVYAEEYMHGKLHKLKFRIEEVVPEKKIVYAPASWLLRIYFPKNSFSMEKTNGACIFTASVHLRIGRIGKWLAKNHIREGLASVKEHMREEGENLKKLLERH